MKVKPLYSLSPLLTKEPKNPTSIFFRCHSLLTEAEEIPAASEKHLPLLEDPFPIIKFWVKLRCVYKSTSYTSFQTYPEVGLLVFLTPAQCMFLHWWTDPSPLMRGRHEP